MQVIGHSFLPPYWALGFHQARFGFMRNMSILEQTLEGFINNSIPLQVKCLFVTLFAPTTESEVSMTHDAYVS
jgi:alpha-glucosidase (family GH31 glycosyl hydrolase)